MATITAASTSSTDVQAALNTAVAGDTVQIPAGSSNWSTFVSVTKAPITVIGAGQASTIITNTTHASSGLETPCFFIQSNTDARIEMSGFKIIGTYVGSNGSNGIEIASGTTLTRNIVLHDITFQGFSFGVYNGSNGNCALGGVVYNCSFNNVKITCRNSGFLNSGALHGVTVPSPAWGTNNYFVYEDNTITFTAWTGGPQGANYCGDTEYPMNYIIRHCTFNVNRTGSIEVDMYDMHGTGGVGLNGFGCIIHDNVFNYTGGSVGARLSDIRGGVGSLTFNNAVHGQNGCYMTLRADPAGSIAPTQTYTWNNTEDAGAIANPGSVGPPSGYTELAYPHPLRGVVTPTKIISLSGIMTFGNVLIGSTLSSTLTVSNTGDTLLTVTSVSYPTAFTGATTGFTVAAGASHNITVTFTPVAATTYTGNITVTSDATSGTNTIACSGTGTSSSAGTGHGRGHKKGALSRRT